MTTNVEKELLDIVSKPPVSFKIKDKENRQKMLNRLLVAVNKLDDDVWDKVSLPAQKWAVAAGNTLNDNADKAEADQADLPEFEEFEKKASGSKSAKAKDTETEKPAAKKTASKKAAQADEEAADADKPAAKKAAKKEPVKASKKAAPKKAAAKDEPKATAKKTASKKAAKVDDDKPAAKKAAKKEPVKASKKAAPKQNGDGVNNRGTKLEILRLVAKRPNIETADLMALVDKKGIETTETTVRDTRGDFRRVVTALNEAGLTDISL